MKTKLLYTVEEISDMLDIRINQAYILIRKQASAPSLFPVLKVGRQYKIPVKPFDAFIGGESTGAGLPQPA